MNDKCFTSHIEREFWSAALFATLRSGAWTLTAMEIADDMLEAWRGRSQDLIG